eukprot:jgi/Chrzof1/13079/Cz07g19020.t1
MSKAPNDPVKEQIAQEKFGKSFDDLEGRERQSVGGTKGGQARKEQLASEHGGDASAGYSDMGTQRKEQMAAEHGGDASAGYAEMGSKGGSN